MRYLTIYLLVGAAALAGCSRDPVDEELVGSWQAAITSPVGAWQLRFTTLSNGQYRTDFIGPFPVAPETGYFTAADGEWRLEKITGSTDEGTYQFLSEDSVLFQSAAGAVVWSRLAATPTPSAAGLPGIPSSIAAPEFPGAPPAPGAFLPALPSAAVADVPNPFPAATAPSDLLATGPFGSALVERSTADGGLPNAFGGGAPGFGALPAAGGNLPSGLGGGTSGFGALPAAGGVGAIAPAPPPSTFAPQNGMPVAPAPFGVPRASSPVFAGIPATETQGGFAPQGGFASPRGPGPQNVGAAVGSVENQLRSNVRTLTDLPGQTRNTLENTAQQAAADVIGQATAPVTEAADEATRKAGQKIQTFTANAASRVRNFFTGNGKRNKAEEKQSTEQKDR